MRHVSAIVGVAAVALGIEPAAPMWTPSTDTVTFKPLPPEKLTKRQRRRLRGKRGLK